MNDAKFLEECGIAIDPQWLASLNDENAQMNLTLVEHESTSEESRNYVTSLARIAKMLGPFS
jgi:hypothetical protein